MDQATPNALVLLAGGAEEMEVVITVDVLRRAGIDVVLAGIDGEEVVACSRGVRITPDTALSAVVDRAFDAVVLPGGGEGSERLAASEAVGEMLRRQSERGAITAAICAAPAALVAHGIGRGSAMTSHPAVTDVVAAHAEYRDDDVVRDGPIVTSRGPGTAFEFALALVAALRDQTAAAELRGPMMLS